MVEPGFKGALDLPKWVPFHPAVHHLLAQGLPHSHFVYLKDKNTDWWNALTLTILSWEIWTLPLSFLAPVVPWGLSNDSLMKELWAGVGAVMCKWIGTSQCLIICILVPDNGPIPSVYFHLLFSYFHDTNAILCLLLLPSKSSIARGLACTLRSSILSLSVSFDSTVPLATAFLEYPL